MQKSILKRIAPKCVALVLLLTMLFVSLTICASAEEEKAQPHGFWEDFVTYSPPGQIKASAVYEMRSEQMVYAYQEDMTLYPASTVKILSGLVACEKLENRLHEVVTITLPMINGAIGNSMKLKVGEQLTIQDLLFGLIVGGYNDAAQALSMIASGSVTAFVEAMNQKALDVGAMHSNFTNPSGLHDELMVSTASDLVLISAAAMQQSLYREITGYDSYYMSETNVSASRTFYNRSDLVTTNRTNAYYDDRCIGLNSGATDEGGYCVVTSTKQDSGSYIVLVMGGQRLDSGSITAYTEVKSLINWAYRNFGKQKIATKGEIFTTFPISGFATASKVNVTLDEDVVLFMPSTMDWDDLNGNMIRLKAETLEAPISEGEFLGYIRFGFGDKTLGTAKLVSVDEITLQGVALILYQIEQFEKNPIVTVSFAIFIVLLVALTILFVQRQKRRSKMSRAPLVGMRRIK